VLGAVQVVRANARVSGDAAVVAGVRDLHPPPASPAPQNALQQRDALAGGAAALPAWSHVVAQSFAGREVLIPGDISGMVIGQADGPLLDRQRHAATPELSVLVKLFALHRSPEHERAHIRRIGQKPVHRTIRRRCPTDAPLTGRPSRQRLPVFAQHRDDLTRRAESAPQLEHAADHMPDLLIGTEHDQPVLPAVQADGEVLLKLTALGLVPKSAIKASADQVQLRLRHRAL
jgi:hypothetical protein